MNTIHRLLTPSPHRSALVLLAGLLLVPIAPSARADAVDDLLSVELRARHLPAIAVAVSRDGQVVKAAAGGFADLELGVPATTGSVFQIQSITKTFTAAAILLLADEGKLALSDPVAKHLDGTPDAWKDITIRHLLNHTSGIKDFINEPTASLRLDVTEEEVFRATAPRPLNFPPGERYAYSNSNYHLLAMIIRRLSGQWYADFLRERVFLPLGMTNTRAVSLTELIPHRASGYVWTGRGFQRGDYVAESILSYGGGGIVSPAPDLVLWGQALMAGKVLKPESLAQAWTPATLNGGGTSGYGLGWGIGNVAGHREINHSGGHATGFSSFLGIYPEDRLAVVVLLNRRGANPARIARRVAGLYVADLAPQPEKPIEDQEPETTARLRECITNTPDWRLVEGQFTSAMWSTLETQRADLQASAKALGPLQSLELLSRDGPKEARVSRYRAAFANGTVILSLTRDAEGRISGLNSGEED